MRQILGTLVSRKMCCPLPSARHGYPGNEEHRQRQLLQAIALKDCLSYVLSLPVHCVAMGCTTVGQVEDDVRIAQQFKPLDEASLDQIRQRAAALKGPQLEDWKINTQTAAVSTYRDGGYA